MEIINLGSSAARPSHLTRSPARQTQQRQQDMICPPTFSRDPPIILTSLKTKNNDSSKLPSMPEEDRELLSSLRSNFYKGLAVNCARNGSLSKSVVCKASNKHKQRYHLQHQHQLELLQQLQEQQGLSRNKEKQHPFHCILTAEAPLTDRRGGGTPLLQILPRQCHRASILKQKLLELDGLRKALGNGNLITTRRQYPRKTVPVEDMEFHSSQQEPYHQMASSFSVRGNSRPMLLAGGASSGIRERRNVDILEGW